MRRVVAVDIGGTHARFAIAQVDAGRVETLGPVTVLKTAEHGSLELAWQHYAGRSDEPLPNAAAIAVASPLDGDVLKLTNSPWVIQRRLLPERLKLDALTLVNDFGAIGHAVGQIAPEDLGYLCGPDKPLPDQGVVTIVGPGTGLGVAHLLRRGSQLHVIETEGGHIDFAPLDTFEDAMLRRLRERYRRASVERVVAGPGLANIYDTLAAIEGRTTRPADDNALWTEALQDGDTLAVAALDRFCLSLGAVAGDLALAHGASAVVIAGGVGLRLAAHLPRSGFAERFVAKGRFEARMRGMPVKLLLHPQPGLLGAAAAFAAEHEA